MEYVSKIKEVTDAMHKLNYKLKNADKAYRDLLSNYSSLYQARNSVAAELEELNHDLETVENRYQSLEKKEKKVEGQIADWMLNMLPRKLN